MKRILVDVDCVVADLMTAWLGIYNKEYNDTLSVDQIVRWELEEFVKPECGKKIYDYLWLAHLYDCVKPIDGAIISIHWLRQHGYDVRFVTSGVHAGKVNWLANHGLLIDEFPLYSPDVVVAHDKSIIKGDILIDDNPKNCDNFPEKSILFAQPWNFDTGFRFFRAENWPDIIQYIARGL